MQGRWDAVRHLIAVSCAVLTAIRCLTADSTAGSDHSGIIPPCSPPPGGVCRADQSTCTRAEPLKWKGNVLGCLCMWNLVVYPPTVGSYSCVIVNSHSSSHRGNYNNRYILWSSRWLDNTFLGLFKSSEAFLRGILDKEERSFQSRQEFVRTLATWQDPKYLE